MASLVLAFRKGDSSLLWESFTFKALLFVCRKCSNFGNGNSRSFVQPVVLFAHLGCAGTVGLEASIPQSKTNGLCCKPTCFGDLWKMMRRIKTSYQTVTRPCKWSWVQNIKDRFHQLCLECHCWWGILTFDESSSDRIASIHWIHDFNQLSPYIYALSSIPIVHMCSLKMDGIGMDRIWLEK